MKTITNLSLLVIAAWMALMLVGCSTYPDKAVKVSPASTEAGKAAADAESATAKATKAARASFLDGTYRVPGEMKPGVYKTAGPADEDGLCYWERLRGFKGGFEDIIANGDTNGPDLVEVRAKDKGFRTNGCQAWRLVK